MKSSRWRSTSALLGLMALLAVASSAQGQVEGTYQVIIKKQEEKKQSRWTLAEWLALKERNRQMDLWLARNSQTSPFEFFLELSSRSEGMTASGISSSSGSANAEQATPTGNRPSYGASFAAYAAMVGLRGNYEREMASDSTHRTRTAGSFNLRCFGRAVQDSNLNLEYGILGLVQSPNGGTEENFQSQFGGGTLTLYLTKHFGIDGSYHKILKSEPSTAGRTAEGDLILSGVFIDFSFVRVFGSWRKERLEFSGPGGESVENKEGFGGGLRFFF